MEDSITYYKEYRQLIGCSEERKERSERITRFVEAYNRGQVFAHQRSIQCKMYHMNEDIERMQVMKASLSELTESHRQLLVNMRHFVHTDRLNNIDVNHVFTKMKRIQHARLETMAAFVGEREAEIACIQEHIDEFRLAYDAKRKTLVHLRKNASAELVAMFDRYLLMASSFTLLRGQPELLAHIFGHTYLRLIFSDVVLITEHMIGMAFATLDGRQQQ